MTEILKSSIRQNACVFFLLFCFVLGYVAIFSRVSRAFEGDKFGFVVNVSPEVHLTKLILGK